MSRLRVWIHVGVVLVCVPVARAQVQLEWDRDLQVPSPEQFVMGTAYPDGHGGSYVTGSRAVLVVSGPGNPNYWVPETPMLLRFDAQGIAGATQDLAPTGSDGVVPLLAVDVSGGVVATGVPTDASILRLDAAGLQMWTAPVPPGMPILTAIGFAPNGTVLAGGYQINGAWTMGAAGWTSAGASAFAHLIPNTSQSGSVCALSATGSFAIASSNNLFNPGSVTVYHSDGTLAWSGSTAVGVELSAVQFTPSGELIAVGDFFTSSPIMTRHAQVLAWSASGTSLWSSTDSGLALSHFRQVSVSSDGLIAVVGDGYPQVPGNQQALITLFDANGSTLWTNLWSGTVGQFGDGFHQVIFRGSGDIVAAGRTFLSSAPTNPALQGAPAIACFGRDGVLAWQYIATSLHNDEAGKSLYETASGSIVYACESTTYNALSSDPAGGRLLSVHPDANGFCFGDGSGTACPCTNSSTVGAGSGCLDSFGLAAHLGTSGTASLASDSLVLRGSGMTNSSVLYFQGTSRVNGGAGTVFGDGKRCAGGTNIRLGSKPNTSGASQYPSSGDPAIHVTGAITTSGVRTYQGWYRNVTTFCTSAPYNSTNGVEVIWGP